MGGTVELKRRWCDVELLRSTVSCSSAHVSLVTSIEEVLVEEKCYNYTLQPPVLFVSCAFLSDMFG